LQGTGPCGEDVKGWSFEKVGDCDFFLSLDGRTLKC